MKRQYQINIIFKNGKMGLNSFLLPNTSTQFEFTGLVTHRRQVFIWNHTRTHFGMSHMMTQLRNCVIWRHSHDFHI